MAGKSINIEVYVKRGESIERAIKRFGRRVKKSGILEDHIKRKHYVKPSEKNHRKKLNMRRAFDQQNKVREEEEKNLYRPNRKKKRGQK